MAQPPGGRRQPVNRTPRCSRGTEGRLKGEVTDPAGASIANASVAVTNSLTQVVRRTKTDPGGRYSIDGLDPGHYTLDVEAPGFTPHQISGVALDPAQQSQKDVTLAVGSLSPDRRGPGPGSTGSRRIEGSTRRSRQRGLAAPALQRFEITTDTGEHWISTDGRSWERKDMDANR